MHEKLGHRVELIGQVAANLVNSRGKQLRMRLTLLAAHMFGIGSGSFGGDASNNKPSESRRINDYLCLGAAIELIHNATLLHDDILDKAKIRRGETTAHLLWGERATVLVGDFMFARAFELMVDAGSMSALNCLSRAATEIVAGEVQQNALIRNPSVPFQLYLDVIDCKTGALFAAAMMAPAMIADASSSDLQALNDFGIAFGRLFQMIDDLLDYFQPSDDSGKAQLKDLRNGVVTLPIILAYNKAPEFWQKMFEIESPLDFSDEVLERLKSDALEAVRAEITSESNKARLASSKLPSGLPNDALLEILAGYLEKSDAVFDKCLL